MSDQTANGGIHALPRVPKTEFFVYFALIFVVAVPVQVLAWIGETVVRGRLPTLGPVTRAWKDARAITPMIFRG